MFYARSTQFFLEAEHHAYSLNENRYADEDHASSDY